MTSKFLQLVRPFMSITPEVTKPEREVRFNEKFLWTLGALIIYFVMSSTPIYMGGVDPTVHDPFEWMRTIMASNKGTLSELGIGPIVTAGLIMQILTGSKIINVDMGDPEERALYTGAQKVMSVFMTIFEAVAYILGGAYGPNLDLSVQLMIIVQLLAAGVAIILLDEMIQKGWGLGSGISLFIAGGVATDIFWNLFSINVTKDHLIGRLDPHIYDGALTGFFQVFFENDPITAIQHFLLRENMPTNSILAVISTVIVFFVVIYFESMRVEIPMTYANYRGFRGSYPIKLLYTSNIPVILVSAVFADLYFISQMLWNTMGQDGNNILINLLGEFNRDESGQITPIGGLIYFLTPPRGIIGPTGVFGDNWFETFPRALVYAAILVTLSVGFSMMWVETAGMGPKDVAKQLISAGMQIPGYRRSEAIIEKKLERVIPPAAFIGGLFIGLLAAGADFLGAIGTGTGILLSVSIMRQYFDILAKERAAEMHPALRDFLGIM